VTLLARFKTEKIPMKQIKHLLPAVLFSLSLFCGPALHAQFQYSCGQNLVPNPGFEDHTACPNGISELALAAPWFQPTVETPDYLNACGASQVSVPNNEFGSQPAHGGQAYAGAAMYALAGSINNYVTVREYMEVPLLSPLAAGHTYAVSFYVSLASLSSDAIDNVGAYLSVYPLTSTSYSNLTVTAQVRNPAGHFLNSANWTLIQGTFTAMGGESYLTIGNFYDNANTPLEPATPNATDMAYYFVDDVSVTDTNLCNICSNSCITISNPGNITVDTCSNSLPVFYSVGVIDNCCANFTLTTSPASGFNFPVGTTIVNSTVTDNCGNTNTCSFSVTVVQDTNSPIIYSCPANIVICGTNGCGIMPDATSELQAVAATGGTNVTVTQSIPPGTEICSGTNVTFTVADACGDATNCTVPCILNTNPPVILSYPTNIVICSGTNGCGYMPDATSEVVATNADGSSPTITQSIPPGTQVCANTSVTFTVTDACGDATNCTVPCTLINCASNSCLQIQCWTNIVVTSCTNLPVFYYPTATDACCSNLFSYCSPPSGNVFSPGTTNTVTFVATDTCGGSNSCTFTVTVEPGTDCTNCLSLVCSNLVVDTCSTCTNVSLTNAVSYSDPCCSNSVSLQFFQGTTFISPTSICFPVDSTNPVTVVAMDGCGNAVTNMFTVTVNPAFPQVQTPGNIVIDSCTNVLVTYPPLVVTDPCCGSNWSVVYDPPSGTSFAPGTSSLVNWFAYDCNSGSNYFAANSFLVIVVCTNCCEGPITNYTVTVAKGSNYLADCLCQEPSNTLADVIPSVPAGTEVYFWNPTAGKFNPVDTFTSGAWHPGTEPMNPGEGFLLVSPTNAYQLTIDGVEPGCGSCTPLDCFSPTMLAGDYGIDPNPGDFCTRFCCPPPPGTEVQVWDAGNQSFTTYAYSGTPPPPGLAVGYSEFVSVNKAACLAGTSNLQIVRSGTTQVSSLSMTWSTNGIPINYWQPQYSTDLVHWLTLPITGALNPPIFINNNSSFSLSAPYQFYRLAATNIFQTN
jgi:hypothetical protein